MLQKVQSIEGHIPPVAMELFQLPLLVSHGLVDDGNAATWTVRLVNQTLSLSAKISLDCAEFTGIVSMVVVPFKLL